MRIPPIPCPHVIRSSVAMTSRLALVVDVGRIGAGGRLRRSPAPSAKQHPAARRRCMQGRESTTGAGAGRVRPFVGPALHIRVPAVRRRGKTAGGVDGDGARYGRLSGPALHTRVPASPRPQRGAERRVAARRTWAATGARSCAVDAGVDPVAPAAHDRCAHWRNPHPTRHREVDDETGTDGARVDRAPPPRRGRPRRDSSTICCRNAAGYGGLDFGIVDSSSCSPTG